MNRLHLVLALVTTTAACSKSGPSSGQLPSDCNAYSAQVDKLTSCEHLTKDLKDLFLKRRQANLERWASVISSDPNANAQIASMCQNQLHALEVGWPAACKSK